MRTRSTNHNIFHDRKGRKKERKQEEIKGKEFEEQSELTTFVGLSNVRWLLEKTLFRRLCPDRHVALSWHVSLVPKSPGTGDKSVSWIYSRRLCRGAVSRNDTAKWKRIVFCESFWPRDQARKAAICFHGVAASSKAFCSFDVTGLDTNSREGVCIGKRNDWRADSCSFFFRTLRVRAFLLSSLSTSVYVQATAE